MQIAGENVGITCALLEFVGKHMNENGTLPWARTKGLWDCLYNRGVITCELFRAQIPAKIEHGFWAVRIHQDWVEEHGAIAPSYYSVRRFVARLKRKTPLPFWRMEAEAQVDFGTGAAIRDGEGEVRRPRVYRTRFAREQLCQPRKQVLHAERLTQIP
jgi:hypothetical protein